MEDNHRELDAGIAAWYLSNAPGGGAKRPRYTGPPMTTLAIGFLGGLATVKEVPSKTIDVVEEEINAPDTPCDSLRGPPLKHERHGPYLELVWAPSLVTVNQQTANQQMAMCRLLETPCQVVEVLTRACHLPKQFENTSFDLGPSYKLMWPPLGTMIVPNVLKTTLNVLRQMCVGDIFSINNAIAATIIYFDIEKAMTNTPSENSLPVSRVSLTVFVVYFSHWLRFCEEKLGWYPHPHRFAAVMYEHDLNRNREALLRDLLDTEFMRDVCEAIRSASPQVAVDRRYLLNPASFPGSSRVPLDEQGQPQAPSKELFSVCLLDDIRLTGLPSYDTTQDHQVLVAYPLAAAAALVSPEPTVRMVQDQIPPLSFWGAPTADTVAIVSGDALVVGPVFKETKAMGNPYVLI